MSNPLVSVIVPCYNQAQYLSECLDSVLQQTFSNWECIIINDGSPDHTDKVAKVYCEADNRIKYLYKKNGGLSSARNVGINIATGMYILPLDADDKIGSNYLKEAILILQNDKNVKIVYCNAELFGSETGKWELQDYSLKRMLKINMIFCTALFRKFDFLKIEGGYDENLLHGHEDWEMWLSLLKTGGNVFKLDNVHFYYRKKVASMLTKMSLDVKIKIDNYVHNKHADFLLSVFGNPISLNDELNFYKKFYDNIQNDFFYKLKEKIKRILNHYLYFKWLRNN